MPFRSSKERKPLGVINEPRGTADHSMISARRKYVGTSEHLLCVWWRKVPFDGRTAWSCLGTGGHSGSEVGGMHFMFSCLFPCGMFCQTLASVVTTMTKNGKEDFESSTNRLNTSRSRSVQTLKVDVDNFRFELCVQSRCTKSEKASRLVTPDQLANRSYLAATPDPTSQPCHRVPSSSSSTYRFIIIVPGNGPHRNSQSSEVKEASIF